jgi:hypothetical protein
MRQSPRPSRHPNEEAVRTAHVYHQVTHEFGDPPGPDGSDGPPGERKAGQRRHDHVVPIRNEGCDQPLKFQERSRPAMQQQQRQPRSVAARVDEVQALPQNIGGEVRQ